MEMKRKSMIMGAALTAALCLCMMRGVEDVNAAEETISQPNSYTVTETAPYYVRSTDELSVYAEPFSESGIEAQVPAGVEFIVLGETDQGWLQVRYLGQRKYITGENTEAYAGGKRQTLLPVLDAGAGYRVAFLGDSITYGDRLRDQSQSYASLLADNMQAEAYYNYGLNGSCMGGEHPDRFFDRYPEMEADLDLIFVLGGTNDYEFATPLGTMGDTGSRTFYGCLNLLMCSLKQKYPDAQIVFMTPLHRNGGTRQNQEGFVLEDYVNAVLNMGEFYDIPVVDLYHAQGLDFSWNRRYLVDGLHPTAAGHRKIADYLYTVLFPAQ